MAQYIYDIPDMPKSIYERAIESVCDHFTADERIRYIGLYGHINNPGISDIDLILITRSGDTDYIANDFEQLKHSIPHGEFLFWHDPVIASEDQIELLEIFHSFVGLKALFGELLENPPKWHKAQELVHAIVWTSHTRQYCENILNSTEPVNMRHALLAIKCCYISASSYLKFLGDQSQATQCRQTADDMRMEFIKCAYDIARCRCLDLAVSQANSKLKETEWRLQQFLKSSNPELPLINNDGQIDLQNITLPYSASENAETIPAFYASFCELINRKLTDESLASIEPNDPELIQASSLWLGAARTANNEFDNFKHMGGYYILFDHLPGSILKSGGIGNILTKTLCRIFGKRNKGKNNA